MTMKHFLLLAAAAGFLPVLIVRAKPSVVPYSTVLTDLATVQEEIVHLHNYIRNSVFPEARNMMKMSWNEEAAQNARIVSNNCDLAKSNALKRRISNTFCGENKHLTPHVIPWPQVIETWYNESMDFQYGYWSPVIEEKHDRYIQMVWASSYLIGCGVSPCCKTMSHQYLYVCHYCHEGNEPATKNQPYKMGNACEDCPNNCDNGLCTNPCIYYDEYTNCQKLQRVHGCIQRAVKMLCKASCLCGTEIT
ncbi:cysteine rich secretory protein 1 [Phyllostomus discolor]|uniref:Cysteine rich secretory protein 1 n=1 Tax=Phyllostomus discolor TaxID=89673 RepID=A0A834ANZ7_9CHIR|nr:cysteine rich secretory protein 1 [Phyllostomus discolor]